MIIIIMVTIQSHQVDRRPGRFPSARPPVRRVGEPWARLLPDNKWARRGMRGSLMQCQASGSPVARPAAAWAARSGQRSRRRPCGRTTAAQCNLFADIYNKQTRINECDQREKRQSFRGTRAETGAFLELESQEPAAWRRRDCRQAAALSQTKCCHSAACADFHANGYRCSSASAIAERTPT